MKFSAPVAVAYLAAGAYAGVVERDATVVSGVLGKVQSGIDSLDSAVKGFSGDVKPVTSAAEALTATIKSGKTTVDGSSDLTIEDSAALITLVNGLQSHGQTLTDDLTSKRDDIEKGGYCDITRSHLNDINNASQDLVKSVTAKVPSDLRSTAAALAGKINDVLAKAADAFSPANCKNAAGGGSSSAAPSSSAKDTGSAAPSTSAKATGSAPVSTAAPSTTAQPTGSAKPTGSSAAPTSSTPAVVVPGAAGKVAPAGILALAIAAFVL